MIDPGLAVRIARAADRHLVKTSGARFTDCPMDQQLAAILEVTGTVADAIEVVRGLRAVAELAAAAAWLCGLDDPTDAELHRALIVLLQSDEAMAALMRASRPEDRDRFAPLDERADAPTADPG